MSGKDLGWLLPDTLTGHDLLCVTLRIPDNLEYRAAFMGALHMLEVWFNWEKTGDARAAQAAAYWRDLLGTYLDVGDCSDVGIDVRQNEDTPCILEKTYNGGETWAQWANLALCPTPPRTIRYNPATDTIEVSTDGGVTWTPAPEIDPRVINTFPPASSKCDAAASMVRYIRDFIDMLVNIVNAGTALTAAITLIAGFLALIGAAFAALVLLMIDLFTFVTSAGASVVAAAFTSEVYDQLLCIFFCNVDDDGRLDATSLSAVMDDINAQIGGVAAAALTVMFALTGFAGLNNAGAAGLDTDDCSDCGCDEGCGGLYDFTLGDELTWYLALNAWYSYFPLGSWTGSGWAAGYDASFGGNAVYIALNCTNPGFDEVGFQYTASTDGVLYVYLRNGDGSFIGELGNVGFTAGTNATRLLGSLGVSLTGDYIIQVGATTYGSFTLEKVNIGAPI